jgi:hypothetical protein
MARDRAGEAAQPRQQGRDLLSKRIVRVTHAVLAGKRRGRGFSSMPTSFLFGNGS